MPLDVFLALVGFSFVSSVTPGPNNIMLLTSGVNFGFRKTIPHMFGIAIGFGVLLLAVGFGLREIFLQFPVMRTVLKVLGGAYLVYLAWKIANAGPVEAGEEGSKPMSFMAAALFQWVNPKAWAMALTTVSVYILPDQALLAGMVFAAVSLPLVSVWTVAGEAIGRLLRTPRALRCFNIAMAALLIGTMIPAFL